jgi:tetratricopeptide (TPR) repeat protein
LENKVGLAERRQEDRQFSVPGSLKIIPFLVLLAALYMTAAAQEDTVDYWMQRAGEYESNGSLDQAISAIEQALKIDPENASSWLGKGSALSQMAVVADDQKMYNESLQAYDRAIEFAKKNNTMLAEAWCGKGDVLTQMQKGDEAVGAYEAAIELNQSWPVAWAGTAFVLYRMKMYNDALYAYDRAFELYTSDEQRIYDYPLLWYSKGLVLEKLGWSEEASQAYNMSVEDADKIIALVGSGGEFYMNLSEAWRWKGDLLGELGRYDEALEAIDNATRIAPEFALGWKAKGEILSYGMGRDEESLEAFDHALQLNPNGSGAWAGKGNALRSLGRNSEAVQAYDHALKLSPNLVLAWLGKAAALRMMGKSNQSVAAYDEAIKAIERSPRGSSASLEAADAWFGKAESLVGVNRAAESSKAYNQSILAYEEAIQNDPASAKAWIGKGDALLCLRRYNESLQSYERALEILNHSLEMSPKDTEAWWLKAECLESLGQSEAALGAYDNVASLNGSKALGARIRKADLLAELGRVNDSMEAFDGALELLPSEDKDSSFTELWDERTDIYYAAWLADGQILRTCSAWFNRPCGDFENIIMVSSDRVAAWQRGVPAVTNPRQGKQEAVVVSRSVNSESILFPNRCGDPCRR